MKRKPIKDRCCMNPDCSSLVRETSPSIRSTKPNKVAVVDTFVKSAKSPLVPQKEPHTTEFRSHYYYLIKWL